MAVAYCIEKERRNTHAHWTEIEWESKTSSETCNQMKSARLWMNIFEEKRKKKNKCWSNKNDFDFFFVSLLWSVSSVLFHLVNCWVYRLFVWPLTVWDAKSSGIKRKWSIKGLIYWKTSLWLNAKSRNCQGYYSLLFTKKIEMVYWRNVTHIQWNALHSQIDQSAVHSFWSKNKFHTCTVAIQPASQPAYIIHGMYSAHGTR